MTRERNSRIKLNQSQRVKKLTREAKRRVWRENMEKTAKGRDPSQLWKLHKRLAGDQTQTESSSMIYNGRRCITPKAKANAFIQEFAGVSNMKKDKQSRAVRRSVRRLMRARGARQEIEADYTMEELGAAFKGIKKGKAGGPDNLRSDYILHLRTRAKGRLLEIFNYSWNRFWVPQA